MAFCAAGKSCGANFLSNNTICCDVAHSSGPTSTIAAVPKLDSEVSSPGAWAARAKPVYCASKVRRFNEASFAVGLRAYDALDCTTTFREWRPLAEQENDNAQFNLRHFACQSVPTEHSVLLRPTGLDDRDGSGILSAVPARCFATWSFYSVTSGICRCWMWRA